jgi:flagellar hook assembly protein FlgD
MRPSLHIKRKTLRKRIKSTARRLVAARKLTLFSWRWREAFVGLALVAATTPLSSPAQAIDISAVSFSATTVTFEQGGIPNGTTIQFTLSDPGEVAISISKVQNFGDVGTPVALLTQTFTGTPPAPNSKIFWNAQWLINGNLGRLNGNYQFTISLTTGTGAAPVTTTPAQLVVLNSVDIHNISVRPSLDASNSPTFPYNFSYALAKDANVSVGIYNSSNTLVRTLLTNKPQLSEQTISSYTVTWDGLATDGSAAPIGIYTSSFSAVDTTNGGTAYPRSAAFSLTSLAGATGDPKVTFENSVYVFPNPIREGTATFRYQAVRDEATVSLRIYTLTGILVLDKNFGSVPKNITQSFVWPATNESGGKVGRGLYYYVMRESDPQGTLQITKKFAVIK